MKPMQDISVKFKVLMVEDDDVDARMLSKLAEKATIGSLELVRGKSLKDAIQRLKEPDHAFHAILVDLGLPDAEGIEAVLTLQADCPAIPLVVLTGNHSLEIALKVVKNGAQDCLFKGELSPNGLIRSLYYAVERHRLRRDLCAEIGLRNVAGGALAR